MPPITIRPRRHDDDPNLVDISNRIVPDYPPWDLDLHRYVLDVRGKDGLSECWVAESAGAVVGMFYLEEASHLARSGVFYAGIEIDPERWNEGIGSRLYETMLERAAAMGAKRIYGEVGEDKPEALRFVQKRGAQETGHVERISRLDVRAARLDGYAGLEARLRDEGIAISSLAEAGVEREDFLQALYRMSERTAKDLPGSEERGLRPYEEWRRDLLSTPGQTPDSMWVALDGKVPVGIARMSRRGTNGAIHGYTGVAPDYRGRGIATLLKLHTIRWAQENGIQFLFTGNDLENAPMLAINRRLGYKPLPALIEVVKERA